MNQNGTILEPTEECEGRKNKSECKLSCEHLQGMLVNATAFCSGAGELISILNLY